MCRSEFYTIIYTFVLFLPSLSLSLSLIIYLYIYIYVYISVYSYLSILLDWELKEKPKVTRAGC